MDNQPSILQPIPIDVTHWHPDDMYANYPEGARPKSAFFPPAEIELPFIRKKRRYLYKLSDRKYPDQYWAEIVAYLAGGLLDVPVPPAYAAFNSEKKNCGALIEWFYEDGKAEFIAGGQFMQSMIPDFDRKKGTQHNFRTIKTLCGFFEELRVMESDWKKWWAEAFLFDALIGNSDRHQDNWGFLHRRTKLGTQTFLMAPLFDNGTSLAHELNPLNVADWKDDRYGFYIGRGRNHVKWDVNERKGCKHIELVAKLQHEMPEQIANLRRKILNFDLERLDAQLTYLTTFAVTMPLTEERKSMYIRLIALRRARLLDVLK